MIVEVRPAKRKRWHGKNGREDFTRPKKIQALVDTKTMKYKTGLTEEDIEWLKGVKKVNYDLSDRYVAEAPHPFWDSNVAMVTLENQPMFFDTEIAIDRIRLGIMKGSKWVANSLGSWERGEWPNATHIIYDEREEVEVKAAKIEIKKQAVIESAKLSKDRKIQLITILGGKNLKGHSDNMIEVELDKIVEKYPKELLTHIKYADADIKTHALILEGLQKSVLRKKNNRIMFLDINLGVDIEDAIEYLKKDENQEFRFRLEEALETK